VLFGRHIFSQSASYPNVIIRAFSSPLSARSHVGQNEAIPCGFQVHVPFLEPPRPWTKMRLIRAVLSREEPMPSSTFSPNGTAAGVGHDVPCVRVCCEFWLPFSLYQREFDSKDVYHFARLRIGSVNTPPLVNFESQCGCENLFVTLKWTRGPFFCCSEAGRGGKNRISGAEL
jgi:hypothetical protein